jgi:hypothetical protein
MLTSQPTSESAWRRRRRSGRPLDPSPEPALAYPSLDNPLTRALRSGTIGNDTYGNALCPMAITRVAIPAATTAVTVPTAATARNHRNG